MNNRNSNFCYLAQLKQQRDGQRCQEVLPEYEKEWSESAPDSSRGHLDALGKFFHLLHRASRWRIWRCHCAFSLGSTLHVVDSCFDVIRLAGKIKRELNLATKRVGQLIDPIILLPSLPCRFPTLHLLQPEQLIIGGTSPQRFIQSKT
jgi:hypothetical protein